MIAVQVGIIIFLIVVLGLILQDEYRKRLLTRRSARLDRFWKLNGDRRRTVRIDTEIDVIYEVISGGMTAKQTSKSRNISLGGINLALNEKLLPGTFIDLQLNLPGLSKPISTQGKIVWVREISDKFNKSSEERFFATGIKFIQINRQDEFDLQSFIDQHLAGAKSKFETFCLLF